MKPYIVTGRSVTLSAGLIRLNDSQANSRLHNLETTEEEGVYRILNDIHFKHGETFEADTEISKANALNLLDPSDVEHIDAAEIQDSENETTDSDDSGEQDEITTVADLAGILELGIGDVLTMLKEEYEVKLTKGADELPEELLDKLIVDGKIHVEETEEDD